jgi:hypothetical protein
MPSVDQQNSAPVNPYDPPLSNDNATETSQKKGRYRPSALFWLLLVIVLTFIAVGVMPIIH